MPWWPDDQWARMLSGEDCPMCADASLATNQHSDLVTESAVSFIRLDGNQTHTGYSVVILKRHAAELHHLDDEELRQFWLDVGRVGRAVTELFHPLKLDTLVMGHLCPHVHCHVFPQYAEHDPHALIDIQEGTGRLSDVEQRARVDMLRKHLGPAPV
jgi:diadenosine tetraphosphate (Ap4A) HIT family hydrolase